MSTVAPHFAEEAPLKGWSGSGTVFFSMCNLRCVFCQNWDISQQRAGAPAADMAVTRRGHSCLEHACQPLGGAVHVQHSHVRVVGCVFQCMPPADAAQRPTKRNAPPPNVFVWLLASTAVQTDSVTGCAMLSCCAGFELTGLELADWMLKLQDEGACHNINFVTPEHCAPQVRAHRAL